MAINNNIKDNSRTCTSFSFTVLVMKRSQVLSLGDINVKEKTGFKYAVVHWYNYRKGLSAGFLKGFYDLDEAKTFAYDRAKEENDEDNDKVITEDEITDINGPGKYGSPYANWTIVGYGGEYPDGYSTTFYSVVEWFEGVTNEWNEFFGRGNGNEDNEKEWVPRYDRQNITCSMVCWRRRRAMVLLQCSTIKSSSAAANKLLRNKDLFRYLMKFV
jgi:hypothetical protein